MDPARSHASHKWRGRSSMHICRILAYVLTLTAVACCSSRTPNKGARLKKGGMAKHGSRRMALFQSSMFKAAGSAAPPRTEGARAEMDHRGHAHTQLDTLSVGQTKTLETITRKLRGEAENSASLVPTTQGLERTALVWHPELLDNMVQMSHNNDLFRAILIDTRTRVQQILQEDTGLLANLESLSVNGRVKTPMSITRKILYKANRQRNREAVGRGIKDKNKNNDEIEDGGKQGRNSHYNKVYDVVGLRIVIAATHLPDESKEDWQDRAIQLCYRVKNLIGNNWETLVFREKDYVQKPKSNGYQSLHLTAVANYHLYKIPVEFQIRTSDMEQFAQNGPAAHQRYKENFMDDLLSNSFPINKPPATHNRDGGGGEGGEGGEGAPPARKPKKKKKRPILRPKHFDGEKQQKKGFTRANNRKSRSLKQKRELEKLNEQAWLGISSVRETGSPPLS